MKPISIVLLDDHKLTRQTWIAMFAGWAGFSVVGESDSLEEAYELCRSKQPDIVLLDISLKERSGLEAISLIRKTSPASKIIMLTMHIQSDYAKRAFELGASGYVTKNSAPSEVLEAIHSTLAGHRYVCREIKNIISPSETLRVNEPQPIKTLSTREIQIAGLIRDGLTSKEIAEKLGLSLRTAETHRHNILKKLKVKNTVGLVQLFNEHGPFL